MFVDGFENPLKICCSISIQKDEIEVDFSGTSKQINRPINSVYNYTYAYACYALKCAIDSEAPNNDGSFRPIKIIAPEGTIVNPKRPAPVWGRHLTGHYIPPSIYGALAKVIPEKIIAESGSPLWNIYFKGRKDVDEKPFVKMFFMNGGHGARSYSDGPGCLSFPSNVSNQSIEQFENQVPLIVNEKSFVKDTQGTGQFVGGAAQRISFLSTSKKPIIMTIRHERVKFPPRGLLGGGNGSKGIDLVNNKKIPAKTSYLLKHGDIASFQTPGGGGMFPPIKRKNDKIQQDIENGLLSTKKAKTIYKIQTSRKK
jgi:N-methylhydantoinase B